MPSSLSKTKRRIASIKGTRKITKAMELTSTVKTRKFLSSHERGKMYSQEFVALMSEFFAHDKKTKSHYAKPNSKDLPTLYLVISSNMGLCGAYNNNLFRFVANNVEKNDVIAPIGTKAVNHFSHDERYQNVIDRYEYINLNTDHEILHDMCVKIKDDFNNARYRSIRVIYTRYVNSITFEPTFFQLLPVDLPRKRWTNEEFTPPLFDETPRDLIHHLLPSYLTSVLYDVLIESSLSEQASRRTAMDNANDNADELLEKLTIEYNKARQNAITQEITEVIGGANAEQ